jgi:hypothetical protein
VEHFVGFAHDKTFEKKKRRKFKDQKMSLKLAGRLKDYRQELPVQLSVSADFEINRN